MEENNKEKIRDLRSVVDYIRKLNDQSFEGWSDEAKKGYKTALQSILIHCIILRQNELLKDIKIMHAVDPNKVITKEPYLEKRIL
jgi:hypothetical protein